MAAAMGSRKGRSAESAARVTNMPLSRDLLHEERAVALPAVRVVPARYSASEIRNGMTKAPPQMR